MSQELKHRAFRVLIDSIDVSIFEEYLFDLVEKTELKSDSLLFDLLNINFKTNSYKKDLKLLIKNSFSEEELVSLNIYERCLRIKKVDNEKEIFDLIDELSSIHLEHNHTYELTHKFYHLSFWIESVENGFSTEKEKDLLSQIEKYTSKVLERFEFHKEKEEWSKFLDEVIYIEPEKKTIKIKEEKNTIKASRKKV